MKKKVVVAVLLVVMLTSSLVFATGENIMLVGDDVNASGIANDLIMLAGITVRTKATGDYAFVMGADVSMEGNISKDAFIAGATVNISDACVVNRDLYVAGADVTIDGSVNRKLFVTADKLIITENSSIMGDAEIYANDIIIGEGAKIYGTVTYTSEAVASIPENIAVNIIEVDTEEKQEKKEEILNRISFLDIGASVFLVMFILLVFPGFSKKVDRIYSKKWIEIVKSIFKGLLALVLGTGIIFVLLISFYGAAIGLLLLLIYMAIIQLATPVAGYTIMRTIFGEKGNKFLLGIVGTLILAILEIVPYVGIIISALSIILTFGVFVSKPRKDKEIIEGTIINQEVMNAETEEPKNVEGTDEMENKEE